MSNGRNAFGGKNPNSIYVPMSETEQEVVSRLIENGDLQVVIHGWGVVDKPKLTLGDAQVMIPMTIRFDRPDQPVGVTYFDLELRTLSGYKLFREQHPTIYNGQPLMVMAGTEISMVWHIGINHMDPRLVKAILPGAVGLTSRVLDKDTGRATVTGNMKLDAAKERTLAAVRRGEAKVRADKEKDLKKLR
jgi:hypothetical protein